MRLIETSIPGLIAVFDMGTKVKSAHAGVVLEVGRVVVIDPSHTENEPRALAATGGSDVPLGISVHSHTQQAVSNRAGVSSNLQQYDSVPVLTRGELARRVGITKQAVSQLFDELEALRFLKRVPDPTDGRAKLIDFGDTSGRTILDGLKVLREVEEELEAVLGARRTERLHDGLLRLLDALTEGEPGPTR